MQALVLDGVGQPLQLREVPTPQPQAGEVLIQLEAAALNHRDSQRGIFGRGLPAGCCRNDDKSSDTQSKCASLARTQPDRHLPDEPREADDTDDPDERDNRTLRLGYSERRKRHSTERPRESDCLDEAV